MRKYMCFRVCLSLFYCFSLVSLMEIRRYQKSVELLIPAAPFQRLVREIGTSIRTDMRFTAECMAAIQHAAEAHIVELFEASQLLALHAKRVTLKREDMVLVGRVRK